MPIPDDTHALAPEDYPGRALVRFLVERCSAANAGEDLSLDIGNVELRIIPGDSVEIPLLVPPVDAIVVFAGSNDTGDWIKNTALARIKCSVHGGSVHCGFETDFMAVREHVLEKLAGARSVGISGHSRGHPLACRLAEELDARGVHVAFVVTFGGPRWCDASRRARYNARGIPTHRFAVGWDAVPRWPKCGYRHVGKMVCLTSDGKYVPRQKRPSLWTPWRFIFRAFGEHAIAGDYARAIRAWADA